MDGNRFINYGISGSSVAFGFAWHLDYGFWSLLIDTLLGWVYVAYKVAEFMWPVIDICSG